MILARSGVTGGLRWAARGRALQGEAVSGDQFVITPTPKAGGAIVAVIDGLGHGPEAEAAAVAAVHCVQSTSEEDLGVLMAECHRALSRTRGAVITLAAIRGPEMRWLGVGNVEGIVVGGPSSPGRRARVPLRGGVVGHTMPSARESNVALERGDLLMLATDGLVSDVFERVNLLGAPEAVVEQAIEHCRTGRDDALMFAARYDGEAS